MRLCLIFLGVVFLGAPPSWAQPGNYLNIAMLTLPPKWLADIPQNQRTNLLVELSRYDHNRRLDYQNGYLDFYSDSEEPDAPQASSMFYLKLLPTSEYNSVIFVHMQRPFNGAYPSADDTHVVKWDGDNWKDISDKVFPKGVDRKSYFQPARRSCDIEVAPWIRYKIPKERRAYAYGRRSYTYGMCNTVLHWNGEVFEKRSIKSRPLTEEE